MTRGEAEVIALDIVARARTFRCTDICGWNELADNLVTLITEALVTPAKGHAE